jgi:hypothetical protein
MKRGGRIPFVLFVACLVAAMPCAWGASSLGVLNNEASASLSGDLTIEALKVAVTLCHIPLGDPANAQTIVVSQAAVVAHLAHGDYLGECHSACDGVPAAVPKTGQTGCWDEWGNPIDCAGTGQDGDWQKGPSASPRFTDNLDGTVKDNLTGLIWLKDANCFGPQTWTNALTASNNLASGACGLTDGSVAGDWRLPNVRELRSMIDYDRTVPALPEDNPFSRVEPNFYWSSTTYLGYSGPGYTWGVFLNFGTVYFISKRDSNWVWPVRGGQ